jgi:hypothetical protein
MTPNRRAAMREMALASTQGERITLAELARRCGMFDYRIARRALRDIERYGLEVV